MTTKELKFIAITSPHFIHIVFCHISQSFAPCYNVTRDSFFLAVVIVMWMVMVSCIFVFQVNCACLLLICLHLTIIIDLLCNSYIGTITRSASIADIYSTKFMSYTFRRHANQCVHELLIVSRIKIGDGICSRTMKPIDLVTLIVL